MPIRTIETQRLYLQIADQLSALIASGEFAVGQRLPSERDLAILLGVSRPSVREALIALEIAGGVDVRVGAGVFASEPHPVAAADSENERHAPLALLHARRLIEGEIAALAARDATREELAAVRATQRPRLRNEGDGTADRQFHLGIAIATHNSALISVVRDLWDRGRCATCLQPQTPELRAGTLIDHEGILVALEARDARGARAAMRRHLDRVECASVREDAAPTIPLDCSPARSRASRGGRRSMRLTRSAAATRAGR